MNSSIGSVVSSLKKIYLAETRLFFFSNVESSVQALNMCKNGSAHYNVSGIWSYQFFLAQLALDHDFAPLPCSYNSDKKRTLSLHDNAIVGVIFLFSHKYMLIRLTVTVTVYIYVHSKKNYRKFHQTMIIYNDNNFPIFRSTKYSHSSK